MIDSIRETNIPILRKPMSGNLPPGVPTVESDYMGGTKTVGGKTSIQGVYVEGRVIKPITGNLGGYDGNNQLKGIFIEDGKFVASENIEAISVEPVGSGTTPVAKVTLSTGGVVQINAPAQKPSNTNGMPFMAPIWLDFKHAQTDKFCVPSDTDGTSIAYPGKYKFTKYADGGPRAWKNLFDSGLGTYDASLFTATQSSGEITYTLKKDMRCVVVTKSGRTLGQTFDMSVTVSHNNVDTAHACPTNQKYVYQNTQVYDLKTGDTVSFKISNPSADVSGCSATIHIYIANNDDLPLYTLNSGSYVPATYDVDGKLTDGVVYYQTNGTTNNANLNNIVPVTDVYDHLLADYNAGTAKTDTYVLSDGTTSVSIAYKLAADGHKICAITSSDTSILTKLNSIYNDDSIGEAWYYVIDTRSNNESVRFPRTHHGFHGDRGYAKIGTTQTFQMYLHFNIA